jgi:hypothetical protein
MIIIPNLEAATIYEHRFKHLGLDFSECGAALRALPMDALIKIELTETELIFSYLDKVLYALEMS